ncbi:hypothetical protein AE618_00165 [Bosea vaviloviae]|uniref:Uncharacterized protein n=1 Tax=Bosea vaviloviae TaxID=1526658 RepID=A0A0N1F8X3_9HYPH|nr:hypothetical protein AE618_00165 [Bosea vaviloviae]
MTHEAVVARILKSQSKCGAFDKCQIFACSIFEALSDREVGIRQWPNDSFYGEAKFAHGAYAPMPIGDLVSARISRFLPQEHRYGLPLLSDRFFQRYERLGILVVEAVPKGRRRDQFRIDLNDRLTNRNAPAKLFILALDI